MAEAELPDYIDEQDQEIEFERRMLPIGYEHLPIVQSGHICNGRFRGEADYLQYISIIKRRGRETIYTFDGEPLDIIKKQTLAAGSFGSVSKLTAVTPLLDKPIEFIVKVSAAGAARALEEARLFDVVEGEEWLKGKHPSEVFQCSGLVPIRYVGGYILMPVADGDLHSLIGQLAVDSVKEVITILGNILACLSTLKLHYFDLKPLNVLYRCASEDGINVLLADLGSMIPLEGGFTCTYPPPEAIGGIISQELCAEHENRIYTYLLCVFYAMMLTGIDGPHWSLSKWQYGNQLSTLGKALQEKEAPSKYLDVLYLVYKDVKVDNIPPLDEFLKL